DDELARLENRRRERRPLVALAREQRFDRAVAAFAADIDVIGACLFEREADEFAAALDRRPVVELVAHGLDCGADMSRNTADHSMLSRLGRSLRPFSWRRLITRARHGRRTKYCACGVI